MNCRWCGGVFKKTSTRTIFCNRECDSLEREQKKQQRRQEYENSPKRCARIECPNPLPYENRKGKFCSHSCSAKISNFGTVRFKGIQKFRFDGTNNFREAKKNYCPFCSKRLALSAKICKDCKKKNKKDARYKKIEDGEMEHPRIIKSYLTEKFGHICSKCKRDEWEGEKIPLEMDHIDGNPSNNTLKNCRILCRNCHGLTETFGSKNKSGFGRTKKAKEYLRFIQTMKEIKSEIQKNPELLNSPELQGVNFLHY